MDTFYKKTSCLTQSQNSNCLKLGNNFRANMWHNMFCCKHDRDDFCYFLYGHLYDQHYLDNEEVFLT